MKYKFNTSSSQWWRYEWVRGGWKYVTYNEETECKVWEKELWVWFLSL